MQVQSGAQVQRHVLFCIVQVHVRLRPNSQLGMWVVGGVGSQSDVNNIQICGDALVILCVCVCVCVFSSPIFDINNQMF